MALQPPVWCMTRSLLPACLLAAALSAVFPAYALEEQTGEKKALDACDRKLCSLLVERNLKGEDLKCDLTKTWAKSTIQSAETQATKWGFGDARCTVHIEMSRAQLIAALTEPEYRLKAPPHTVDCIVEEEGAAKPIKATLAPKISFKNGKAEKIRINLQKIEGPTAITSVLSAAATLEDRIGLFHRSLLKSVNRYVEKHCPNLLATAEKGKPSTRK
jgi:hypothetical protein